MDIARKRGGILEMSSARGEGTSCHRGHPGDRPLPASSNQELVFPGDRGDTGDGAGKCCWRLPRLRPWFG